MVGVGLWVILMYALIRGSNVSVTSMCQQGSQQDGWPPVMTSNTMVVFFPAPNPSGLTVIRTVTIFTMLWLSDNGCSSLGVRGSK